MWVRIALVALAFVVLHVKGSQADDQPNKPLVSLLLSKASAEPLGRDILFSCDAVLDTATGKDLTVRSNFFSVFDGLELVVTARDGKVLAQPAYIVHQSPFVLGRKFTLKQGRTKEALNFPIPARDLPGDMKTFKVRLNSSMPDRQ
jgi:hypothetical protein